MPNYGTFSKKVLALNVTKNYICKALKTFFRRVGESLKEQIFTIIRCKKDVVEPKIGLFLPSKQAKVKLKFLLCNRI